MYDYEARYRRLRSFGAPGWAGDGQARSQARLAEAIDDLVRRNCIPCAPARVLELGCGNGVASLHLARLGHDVAGIDISATAVAWAGDRFAEAGLAGWFVVGSVCDMRPLFPDREFDLMYDGACWHCLIGGDRSLCLIEVRRVLRPAGTLVVSSMCGVPRCLRAGLAYDPLRAILMENGIPCRTIRSLPDLRAELERHGFAIEHFRVAENPWWDHATVVCRRLP